MLRNWTRILLGAWLVARLALTHAASPEETRAYDTSLKLFHDGLFELAERECAGFTATYTNSERLPDIVLVQVQARLRLKRPDDAIALLNQRTNLVAAKPDEFAFWRAEAVLDKGDAAGAGAAFGQFLGAFPQSPRRLEAAYRQAFVLHQLGQLDQAIALLRNADSPFVQAATPHPEAELAVRGRLLLAEILIGRGDFAGAEQAAMAAGNPATPDLVWQRDYLLARAKNGLGQFAEAYNRTTNFWNATPAVIQRDVRAAALLLQAGLLEKLGQVDPALQLYERMLTEDVPAGQRPVALRQYVDLCLKHKTVTETAQRLEAFINAHPQTDGLDALRLTLGELRFREFGAARGTGANLPPERVAQVTNLLTQARTQFELLLTNHPQSALVGRAQLNRGWCFWEEGTNRLTDSLAAFRDASARLPVSLEQATARFKWADCQLLLADAPGAVSNYWLVATNYVPVLGPTNALVAQALYQIVRAGVDTGETGTATNALQLLLKSDPDGSFADRAELMVGQAFARLAQPQAARTVYEDLTRRFTNSALLAEARLAIAGTYEQEQAWPAAIAAYTTWLGQYSSNVVLPTGLVAQATFNLARASYRSQPDTNALTLLTNFVARFPDNTNAPLAQYLVGEYAFNQGDYARAELHFQDRSLVQNTNVLLSELAYQARLMAVRAAMARQSYRSAREHCKWIIENGPLTVASSPIPVSIVAEAYLFLGDTLIQEPEEGDTNNLARFGEAIKAFAKITKNFPTNEFAPLAWGRIGDCYFQLASSDPKGYDSAVEALRHVIDSPADISVRSQAEWKLGVVLEKQAQVKAAPDRSAVETEALDHYIRVLYGKNLRPGEQPDPYWVKKASVSAAELAEAQKKWDVAIGLTQRLMTEIPALRPRLEKKLEELQAARQKAGGN